MQFTLVYGLEIYRLLGQGEQARAPPASAATAALMLTVVAHLPSKENSVADLPFPSRAQEGFIRVWVTGVVATAIVGFKAIVLDSVSRVLTTVRKDFGPGLDKVADPEPWFQRTLDTLSIQATLFGRGGSAEAGMWEEATAAYLRFTSGIVADVDPPKKKEKKDDDEGGEKEEGGEGAEQGEGDAGAGGRFGATAVFNRAMGIDE